MIQDESMSPTFELEQVVIAHLLDSVDEIEVGDIVVFMNPEDHESQLVRRVKEIDGSHFFLEGDQTNEELSLDSNHFGTVTRDQILAIIDEEAREMERA